VLWALHVAERMHIPINTIIMPASFMSQLPVIAESILHFYF